MRKLVKFIIGLCLLLLSHSVYSDLPQVIERIKPSIVGIGTFQKMRAPSINFLGTGFVVNDGLHIVTNAHVIPELLDVAKNESLVILTGRSNNPEARLAKVTKLDKEHDLALLKIDGASLTPLKIGNIEKVKEGQMLAFTGFPIGMILGFYPVTHRAMIASITPIILPATNVKQLSEDKIRLLNKTAFKVFQLDGTAYPGNSGSPLYDTDTGEVYGVVNMVFVKGKKESALSNPSGISYAIPANFITELLKHEQ